MTTTAILPAVGVSKEHITKTPGVCGIPHDRSKRRVDIGHDPVWAPLSRSANQRDGPLPRDNPNLLRPERR